MRTIGYGLGIRGALALLLFSALPLSGVSAQPAPPDRGQSSASGRANEQRPITPRAARAGAGSDKHPKLDSRLAAAARAHRERGPQAAAAEARDRGVAVEGESVRVVVESRLPAQARSAALAVGGRVEAEAGELARVLVPVSALETLASNPAIAYVRPPLHAEPAAVGGQGPAASVANAWQSAGWNGAGIRVGIIDLGFAGYTALQASGDLPSSLTTVDFCSGTFPTAEVHGAGVAEIVSEMAPGAQLYLICIQDDVGVAQARDYAIAQGIRVINHSVVWFNSSRGDGTGGSSSPDGIVASARAAGILWVNAAGNHALKHWSGTFSDSDSDGYHNFSGADQGNTVFIGSGAQACFFLKWDNWPTSNQDYDLYLVRSSDLAIVASSVNDQSGTQPPTEELCYSNPFGSENFAAYIFRFSATTTPRFDLFSSNALEHSTVAGSVLEPASSPSAMGVGAVCWQDNGLEIYSSQGPTIDGRTKPDIAGQDAVSSGTYGAFSVCPSGFAGTSAAAPHVAGAAALIRQANPGFGPAETQTFLQGRAIDVGPAGLDSQFGSGVLNLGSVPGSATATPGATATNTRTPTVTNTPLPSPTPGPLAQMVSPVPGSMLSSSTVTFTWSAGTAASQYWLWVSTVQGDANLYTQNQGTSLSRTVSGVPTGVPVYVRLFSLVSGDWQYIDYPYGPGVATSTPAVPLATSTPTRTFTPTLTPTATRTPTATSTPTPSPTVGPSLTPTNTPTATTTPTNTLTPTATATRTPTATPTNTLTPTVTNTPGAVVLAQMTSPLPGSNFSSSTVTFSWTSGTGVSQYWLWIGTHLGDSDLLTQNQGTSLSRTVGGLPTGAPVYVRLFSLVAGDWQYIDYPYGAGVVTSTPAVPAATATPTRTPTASPSPTSSQTPGPSLTPSNTPTATATRTPTATPTNTLTPTVTNTPGAVVLAQMVSPAPGSVLASSTVTFSWTSGTGVTQYWLWIGTHLGDSDLLTQNQGTSLSRTVGGLPTGGPVYVRLFSLVAGDWQYIDYPYGPGVVTSTPAAPAATATATRTPTASPSPTSSQTPGPSLTPSNTPTATATRTPTATPTNTLTPTVTNTPGAVVLAQMTSPSPGSSFSSSTVTFSWTAGTGVSQYWLWVSTVQGDANLYTQNQGTSLSRTVSGMPTGVPVYVRLWSLVAGNWQYVDYGYGPGAVQPTPGSA